MKLVKSLLLGSAAGLVAVAGASAADLGVKKPTAVEYVKTCPTYGAGFFVVPGTTSCLKIVGRVRADFMVHAPLARSGNKTTTRARQYVGFDHRTATEYGLLRTYARAYFNHDSGNTASGYTGTNGASSVALEYAFIQFGGLTAGRVAPVFEHGWSPFFLGSGQKYAGGYFSDNSYVNSLGYTFNFGGGFSATIALDDATDRAYMGTPGTISTTGAVTAAVANPRAGHVLPSLNGALVYDQSWGTVRLAGALVQNRFNWAVVGTNRTTDYGYAVEGGVKINLPMLTKGSNIWVSGSYAKGAVNYTGFNVQSGHSVGSVSYTPADFDATGRASTAFAMMGALQVYATPTVAVSVGAAYGVYNPAGANNSIKALTVLGNVSWMPVSGFLIGTEVAYRALAFDNGVAPVATATQGVKKNDVIGRIRFQRDF